MTNIYHPLFNTILFIILVTSPAPSATAGQENTFFQNSINTLSTENKVATFSLNESGKDVVYRVENIFDIDVVEPSTDGFLHSIVADYSTVYIVDNEYFDSETSQWIIKRFSAFTGERISDLTFACPSQAPDTQFFLMNDSEGRLVVYFKPSPIASDISPNPAPSIHTLVLDAETGSTLDEYTYTQTTGFSYQWDAVTGQMAMYGDALGSHWYFLPLYSSPYINVVKYNYPDNVRKGPNYRAIQYTPAATEPYSAVCPLNQAFYFADSHTTLPTLYAGNTSYELGSFDSADVSGNGISAFNFNEHRFIIYGKEYSSESLQYGLATFDVTIPEEFDAADAEGFNPSIAMKNCCELIASDATSGGVDTQHRQLSAASVNPLATVAHFYTYAPGKSLKAYALTYGDEVTGLRTASDERNLSVRIVGGHAEIGHIAAKIEVYDIAGRRVLTAANASTIDVSKLTAGIYILCADNQTAKIAIK